MFNSFFKKNNSEGAKGKGGALD